MPLPRTFYQQNTIYAAKALLGQTLIHQTAEGATAGKIVETEAYLGPEDQAAHSSGGRRTARNEVMYGQKGHAYVYFIYGMYFCLNVTSGDVEGKPEAVLIRALEPLEGVELMVKRRGSSLNLTNGPSRLCIAMGITKKQNGSDLTTPPLTIENAPLIPTEDIVEASRIGVDYAGEWKNKPYRYYIKNNKHVSVK